MIKEGNWGRCYIIVTGASQGLGATLCTKLAQVVSGDSIILGVARSADGLNKTKDAVLENNPNLKFVPGVMDLSVATDKDMSVMIKNSIDGDNNKPFDCSVIIHNAGSLGDLDYLHKSTRVEPIRQYFNLNLSSAISLNATFLEAVDTNVINCKKIYVINISSLCAIQPMKSWGLYCVGKAARDMVFKVVALEREDVKVLNYAPGPLDNDMQVIARSSTADPELRAMFTSMKSDGNLLKMEDSVEKFIKIVEADKFKSGDHVDYFDQL